MQSNSIISRGLAKARKLLYKSNRHAKTALVVLLLFVFCKSFGQRYITISKGKFKLSVIENEDTLFQCHVAVGKNYGNKTKTGDKKTPEGTFTICSIENSSHWKHDFRDGKGLCKGAYGPYFFRLKVPKFNSIGIHGTCLPESIGTRSSEGCIRLNNSDLQKLKSFIFIGMECIIEKDKL